MDKLYLGIDIGGTEVKIGVVTSSGDITKADNFSVNFDNYKTPIIETVLKSLDIFINKNNLDLSTILGIGVSATGQIDNNKGIVAGTAGHIDNWIGTPLKDILKEKYFLPVSVANDANCAVIGEYWKGNAIGCSNVIMITVGTGIGGGIISNGKLLSGKIGIAGELGHFPINITGKKCSCGNIGCYEQYASTTALIKNVKDLLKSDPSINIKNINGKFIFEQINIGNTEIKNIVDEWIKNIAIGIVGLIHIFNPELVLIGGGVSKQDELFITPLCNKVFELIMPGFRSDLKISSASLGNNAGLCGAVYNLITENNSL